MLERIENTQKLAFAWRMSLVEAFRTAGHAVTAEEWATLSQLQGDPGLTPTNLAKKAERDQTTVTRMVDRLVRKGLVERRADPKDRRAQRLFLSRNGYETYADLRHVADALAAAVFAECSPDMLSGFDSTISAARSKFNLSVE